MRARRPRAHRPRRRPPAPAGRPARARERGRALAPLPALRQLAGPRAPKAPAREHPPERAEIALPLRGRPLRDKIVLRAIAVNRAAHFFVLGLLGIAILLFASHRAAFRDRFYRVVADLQGEAIRERDVGWQALERSAPEASPG